MKRLQSRNRKEADYYGRGTMKGCCQKRLMLMKHRAGIAVAVQHVAETGDDAV